MYAYQIWKYNRFYPYFKSIKKNIIIIKTNKFRSFKSINFSQFLLKIKFSSKENMSKKHTQVVFEFKFNFTLG